MKSKVVKVFSNYLQRSLKGTLFYNLTILYVSEEYWIASRGYRLYKFDAEKKEWHYFTRIVNLKYSLFSHFFLTKRLLRAEISQLYRFKNNNLICIAKKGIYKYDEQDNRFKLCFSIKRGSRPMAICQDDAGVLYFGEYFNNALKEPVHIYKSSDDGRNWKIAYTFPEGTINHIHGIFNDLYSNKLWIMTGDLDDECIIGYSEDGFNSLVTLFQGSQQYRACVPLFYKDKVVFATDSQYEQNVIKKFDRQTSEIQDLVQIQGSGIYGGQIGDLAFISTTVEPSLVNLEQNSYLWLSEDGINWNEVLHYKKDYWSKTYFQFGTLRFPNYDTTSRYVSLIVIGRAVKGLDGKSLLLPSIL